MITRMCSNILYSLRLRLCSPCPASESNTDQESVRNTTSSELVSVRYITAGAHCSSIDALSWRPFFSMAG